MKKATENRSKRRPPGTYGKLDKKTLDAALDELIATFEDVNRKLDELLAKARS